MRKLIARASSRITRTVSLTSFVVWCGCSAATPVPTHPDGTPQAERKNPQLKAPRGRVEVALVPGSVAEVAQAQSDSDLAGLGATSD